MAKRPPDEEILPFDLKHAELIAACVIEQLRNEHPIAPVWLNQKQAAVFLGTSGKALEIRRKNKTGPRYSKVAHKFVRYAVADLNSWLEAHSVGSGDE